MNGKRNKEEVDACTTNDAAKFKASISLQADPCVESVELSELQDLGRKETDTAVKEDVLNTAVDAFHNVLSTETSLLPPATLQELVLERDAWKSRYEKLKLLFEQLRRQKIKENNEMCSIFRTYQRNISVDGQKRLDHLRQETHSLHKQIGQLEGELLIAKQETEASKREATRLSVVLDGNESSSQSIQCQVNSKIQKERDEALEKVVQLEAEGRKKSREWNQERAVLLANLQDEERRVQEIQRDLQDAKNETRSIKTRYQDSKYASDRARQYYDDLLAQMRSQLSIQESVAEVEKEELVEQLHDFLERNFPAEQSAEEFDPATE